MSRVVVILRGRTSLALPRRQRASYHSRDQRGSVGHLVNFGVLAASPALARPAPHRGRADLPHRAGLGEEPCRSLSSPRESPRSGIVVHGCVPRVSPDPHELLTGPEWPRTPQAVVIARLSVQVSATTFAGASSHNPSRKGMSESEVVGSRGLVGGRCRCRSHDCTVRFPLVSFECQLAPRSGGPIRHRGPVPLADAVRLNRYRSRLGRAP